MTGFPSLTRDAQDDNGQAPMQKDFSTARTVVRLLHVVWFGFLAIEWFRLDGHGWPWDDGAPLVGLPGCNVPLNLWVMVLICFGILSISKSVYFIFRTEWVAADAPPPLRVKIVELLYQVLRVPWDIIGLYWVSYADQECIKHNETFLRAIVGFCWVHALLSVMIGIQVAFFEILFPPPAKVFPLMPPADLLETTTRPVTASDPSLGPSPVCPICLDCLEDEVPIVVTKACQHAFHAECLQEWLNRHDARGRFHRRCPLCRQDLMPPAEESP